MVLSKKLRHLSEFSRQIFDSIIFLTEPLWFVHFVDIFVLLLFLFCFVALGFPAS